MLEKFLQLRRDNQEARKVIEEVSAQESEAV